MALVVETGSGSATADSYITLADAETMVAAMGWTWAGIDAVKETYLRQAAFYIDSHYKFTGTKGSTTQALVWPRADVVDWESVAVGTTTIPAAVKRAQVYLAVAAYSGTLETDRSGQRVKSESVGPIRSEYFDDGAGALQGNTYVYADNVLAPYVLWINTGAVKREITPSPKTGEMSDTPYFTLGDMDNPSPTVSSDLTDG